MKSKIGDKFGSSGATDYLDLVESFEDAQCQLPKIAPALRPGLLKSSSTSARTKDEKYKNMLSRFYSTSQKQLLMNKLRK